jgi:hypothetical protein
VSIDLVNRLTIRADAGDPSSPRLRHCAACRPSGVVGGISHTWPRGCSRALRRSVRVEGRRWAPAPRCIPAGQTLDCVLGVTPQGQLRRPHLISEEVRDPDHATRSAINHDEGARLLPQHHLPPAHRRPPHQRHPKARAVAQEAPGTGRPAGRSQPMTPPKASVVVAVSTPRYRQARAGAPIPNVRTCHTMRRCC